MLLAHLISRALLPFPTFPLRLKNEIYHKHYHLFFLTILKLMSTSYHIFQQGISAFQPIMHSNFPDGSKSWNYESHIYNSSKENGKVTHLIITWKTSLSLECVFIIYFLRLAISQILKKLIRMLFTYLIGGKVLSNCVTQRSLLMQFKFTFLLVLNFLVPLSIWIKTKNKILIKIEWDWLWLLIFF